MNNTINHRGPDDEGFFILDNDNKITIAGGSDTPNTVWSSDFSYSPHNNIHEKESLRFKLALGHRRLSILDLTPAGHQPMSYADSRYWIVYNGEIYNYKEIRRELINIGHDFKTRSDTEVILAAYAEWGPLCLQLFAGMWAFAIYDHRSKDIFIARDRYAIKPLYYWFSPMGDFCFASEIKQFTVLEGWNARVNPQRVYDYLRYSYTDHTDETMFKDVFQLPGGTFYKSQLGSINPTARGKLLYQKWYSIKREKYFGTFKDASLKFRDLLVNSVKEHLQADVPVGTALSGGLDSSSVVCIVNLLLKSENKDILQKTFSSCSTDARFDERVWMDKVIQHVKIDSHFNYPTLDEVIGQTYEILYQHDEPYQSQSALLAYNLFKAARVNGVKVLLNGQGADEYLGGYGQFTAARYSEMIKRFEFLKFVRDIINSQKQGLSNNIPLKRTILFHLLPIIIQRRISNQIHSSSDDILTLINFERLGAQIAHPMDFIPVKYKSIPEISEHLTFYSTLPKYLHWEDRNSMANSVEARVPFLDHRLVEFTYNLPDDFLEKDGITKRVMRRAISDLVPRDIVNRRDKMGFTTPEEKWVTIDNPGWFRNQICMAIENSDSIIKPEALNFFDKVVNGERRFDYTYWRLILFNLWLQEFSVKV